MADSGHVLVTGGLGFIGAAARPVPPRPGPDGRPGGSPPGPRAGAPSALTDALRPPAGRTGSHTTVVLLEAGYSVTIVDNLNNAVRGPRPPPTHVNDK